MMYGIAWREECGSKIKQKEYVQSNLRNIQEDSCAYSIIKRKKLPAFVGSKILEYIFVS